MHKVFISYHHQNDQWYKEYLVNFGERHSIFIDESVDTGGIPDDLPDERIREKIRGRLPQRFYGNHCLGRDGNTTAQACGLGDLFEHVRWSRQQEVGSPGPYSPDDL